MLSDSGNTVMPVMPMGNTSGFGGFGGDGGWLIILFLFALMGGWGNGGFGGGFGGNGEFPWLMTGQQNINSNTNNGFRDAMLNDGIMSIRDSLNGISTQLCGCCSDMQMTLANGFSGVESGANARQMANMQTMFGIQSTLQNNAADNRASIADLKYTVATENCADRAAVNDGIRSIITNNTANTQAILDKLCTLELDNFKRENENLRTQLNMAALNASQTAQTAQLLQGQNTAVENLYTRLSNCPVPAVPVYGKTNIFSCSNGCGCGM